MGGLEMGHGFSPADVHKQATHDVAGVHNSKELQTKLHDEYWALLRSNGNPDHKTLTKDGAKLWSQYLQEMTTGLQHSTNKEVRAMLGEQGSNDGFQITGVDGSGSIKGVDRHRFNEQHVITKGHDSAPKVGFGAGDKHVTMQLENGKYTFKGHAGEKNPSAEKIADAFVESWAKSHKISDPAKIKAMQENVLEMIKNQHPDKFKDAKSLTSPAPNDVTISIPSNYDPTKSYHPAKSNHPTTNHHPSDHPSKKAS